MPVHEYPVQGHLEQQAAQVEHHDHARPRHRGGVTGKQPEHHGRGHTPRDPGQVFTDQRLDGRLDARERNERIGKAKCHKGDQAENERQPHALAHFFADVGVPPGAEQARDDGRDGDLDAHQRTEHAEENGATDAHGREIDGAVPPGHDGIDHAIGHDRQLRNQHRPAELEQLTDEVAR